MCYYIPYLPIMQGSNLGMVAMMVQDSFPMMMMVVAIAVAVAVVVGLEWLMEVPTT